MCIRDRRTSLANRGALIQVRDLDEACRIANDIAPEHLEISTEQPEIWTAKIRHAGAIFMGRFSSEALGAVSYTHLDVYKRQA